MAVHSCAGFPQHTWCSVWWWFCCSKARLDVWDQTLQWLVIPEQHTWACWGIWCGEKNICFGSLEPTESSLAFCFWDWQCQGQVHQGEEVTVAGVQTVDLGPVQSGKSLLPIPPAVHVCLEAGPLVVQLAHFKSWLDHRLEVLGQNQGVTGWKQCSSSRLVLPSVVVEVAALQSYLVLKSQTRFLTTECGFAFAHVS